MPTSLPAIRNRLQGFRGFQDNLSLAFHKLNHKIDDGHDHDCKDAMIRELGGFRPTDALTKSYTYAYKHWRQIQKQRKNTLTFAIKSTTKVLLGTGNASVFEFGLQLNHPWGVPYISGSTLKGILSSYLERNGGEDWKRSSGSSKKSAYQVELFGGSLLENAVDQVGSWAKDASFIGSVYFYDAWMKPNSGSWFVGDIITPHHQDYYSGRGFPDGTKNPTPVKMVALRPGLQFLVTLEGPNDAVLSFVRNQLLAALEKEGIGGKTAVGYGRFETDQSDVDRLSLEGEKEKIRRTKDASELRNLYDTYKSMLESNEELRQAFVEALSAMDQAGVGLDDLDALQKELDPFGFLERKITSLQELSKTQLRKRFKRNFETVLDSLVESEEDSQSASARKLFASIIERFQPTAQEIEENWILSRISFQWADLKLDSDACWEYIEAIEKGTHVWPPVEGFGDALQKSPLLSDEEKEELKGYLETLS